MQYFFQFLSLTSLNSPGARSQSALQRHLMGDPVDQSMPFEGILNTLSSPDSDCISSATGSAQWITRRELQCAYGCRPATIKTLFGHYFIGQISNKSLEGVQKETHGSRTIKTFQHIFIDRIVFIFIVLLGHPFRLQPAKITRKSLKRNANKLLELC